MATPLKKPGEQPEYLLHEIRFSAMTRLQLAGGADGLLNLLDKAKGDLEDEDALMGADIYEKLKFTTEELVAFQDAQGRWQLPLIMRHQTPAVIKMGKHELRFLREALRKPKISVNGQSDTVRWRPIDREWVLPLLQQIEQALNTHT